MNKVNQKLGYRIRPMEEKDISQVLEIDREAFPTQWPCPTYSSFKQELNNRLAHYLVAYMPLEILNDISIKNSHDNSKNIFSNFIHFFGNLNKSKTQSDLLLPASKELIIGIAGFWLMVGEAHIITIAVRSAYRRKGVGEKMLIYIIDKAIALNANVVTLEVRVSNTIAQSLYCKYGFNVTGTRPKYYTDNGENAFIMSTDCIKTPDYILKFQSLKELHQDRWGRECI